MSNLFRSNDMNLKEILESINKGKIQLPDFQRGWVWDDHRIKALVTSIMNSFPVGAVMFLDYGSENVRFKYRAFANVENGNLKPESLVLDGQQRLTSTFCAMFSEKVVEINDKGNETIKRFYYLDMKKCLDDDIDNYEAIISVPENKLLKSDFGKQIDLDLSSSEKEFKNHMFPLNIVFDSFASSEWRNEYQAYHDYEKEILKSFTQFETKVLNYIQSYKLPIITLNKETPKEAVCQVFENVNTGGVTLTVFELVTDLLQQKILN